MPMPVVEPIPLTGEAPRPGAPLLAQDASYFAASARMANFCSISMTVNIYSHGSHLKLRLQRCDLQIFTRTIRQFFEKNSAADCASGSLQPSRPAFRFTALSAPFSPARFHNL